ncbi:alpha-N-arabinofuranosidase [Sphaerotilus hippei]|uniref:Alpha-N-arabinofuranosidase n=1 Tax=Sphaerotilus hippei TaxID=744406 RepID=A0A318H3B3_9BURK|nr:hypothetical protein [Sphaerotilus hippei]PXW96192.1 alpha-N-arabinofuranosidase [Sphaerotilus hippei]
MSPPGSRQGRHRSMPAGGHEPRQDRRHLLLGSGLALLGGTGAWATLTVPGCSDGALATPPDHLSRFDVHIDVDDPGAPLNAELLGHNVQWVDRGDDLLRPDGRPEPAMLARLAQLAPTVLRFPGGAQSDVYHWQRGVGPLAQRRSNEHFHNRQQQPSILGTAEFLDLCERTGAQPVITVNVPSGTPEEAAAWVRAVNVDGLRSPQTGRRLRQVQRWEIGNEPYLKDEARPELAMEPEAFARQADRIIRAMRAVDPSLLIGLPLSNDRRNGVPVVHFTNYARRVLATLTERVDIACVHNAYLPFGYDRLDDPQALYWATMGGSRTVMADLDALHRLIAEARPGLVLPVALTEYHAIFSLGRGASDEWTGSPAAALYVTDLLMMLARRDDVRWANLWSLSGNWRFGAIHGQGWLRPVGEVLALMRPLFNGERLPARGSATTAATPAAGLVAAVAALPLVETLATLEPGTEQDCIRLLLLHKHPTQAASGTLRLTGLHQPGRHRLRLHSLSAPSVMRADDATDLFVRQRTTPPADAVQITDDTLTLDLTLPPASVSLLECWLPATHRPASLHRPLSDLT